MEFEYNWRSHGRPSRVKKGLTRRVKTLCKAGGVAGLCVALLACGGVIFGAWMCHPVAVTIALVAGVVSIPCILGLVKVCRKGGV